MTFKERALVDLTEVINDKKNKLSRHSFETLVALREEIKLQKTKKGLLACLAKAADIAGILTGGNFD